MATSIEVPRRLPLLLVADNVLLPGSSMRIPVRSLRNMNMVKSRLLRQSTLGSAIIGVVLKEPGIETDEFTLHPIGTAAVAVQVTGTNWPEPAYTLLVTGLCRFKIEEVLQETPYPIARVAQLENVPADDNDDLKTDLELGNLVETFRQHAMQLVNMLDISVPVVAKLKKMLDNVPSQQLPDICVSIVKASLAEKVQVLDAVDLAERFKRTLPLLMRQIEGLKLLQKSRAHKLAITPRKPSRGKTINIRKAMERLEGGKRELEGGKGRELEETEEEDEIVELENKIKTVGLTPAAMKAATRELKRLNNMPQQMPEHAMIRNYLELMVELPWNKTTTDSLDIALARKDLDTDHYGLDKLKKRVIEYLAVRQLKNSLKGPILCFVGPPGVGKTSIGRSIAQTLGREFYRIALGGMCDQADIRGHRRTYIGSMTGRIIQGLKLVGVKNPVFLLDEIDKLGTSLHGDPASALLEVLDPEQNHAFVDHYLNVPFDLSQVLFIATANTTATIPAALLDRMELIQIPGYTHDEKTHIAMRHLMPKQLGEHGLNADMIHIPEDSIKVIVSDYTREAGVRTLERRIAAVCRAVAVRVTEYNAQRKEAPPGGEEKTTGSLGDGRDAGEVVDVVDASSAASLPPEMPIVIDEHAIEDILGPAMYESETAERLSQPGVAVGLAWTVLGGEIMFVEATKMEGEGKLTLTGQLGDIMKESASLALNWVRSHANELDIHSPHRDLLESTDIHIHFPAGAVMKDGPSAGVTIVTVLVSLFTGRCVRSDTAMTGEVTLRGLVLPIGGLKAKVLAAHRAGISRVILPRRNEKDLHEVPSNIKKELSFILASRLEDVLDAAFDDGFPNLRAASPLIPSKI